MQPIILYQERKGWSRTEMQSINSKNNKENLGTNGLTFQIRDTIPRENWEEIWTHTLITTHSSSRGDMGQIRSLSKTNFLQKKDLIA